MNQPNQLFLPDFSTPKKFLTHSAYLEYLVWEGAKWRSGSIDDNVSKRIKFELASVTNAGVEKYFLVVHDIISAAREQDVFVGPGRGNASGSIICYCLLITDVDPIAYGLLFERMIHPELANLPDIDSDVDEEGRAWVIEYTRRKYNGQVVIKEYNDGYIEKENVLSLDFLSSKPFTDLKKLYQRFTGSVIPDDDLDTLRLFQRGDMDNIPFFEKKDMREYLRTICPKNSKELTAIFALYYCQDPSRMNVYIEAQSRHPTIMSDIVAETYGVIVYQEQLMLLVQTIANMSPGDSDILRRAFQKKNESVIANKKDQFFNGGINNNYTLDALNDIWNDWKQHASCFFNKSHAASFSQVAYRTAYLHLLNMARNVDSK